MKKYLIGLYLALTLTACDSGGSGASAVTPPEPVPKNRILPLNLTIHDLNNNLINVIDVYKVGSVFKYKETFTNPNIFTVSKPLRGGINSGISMGADTNWLYANHKTKQPGTEGGDILGTYYKTTNLDDCFNVNELPPGASCSFYTIAQYVFNTTAEENFTYPISYIVKQISDPSNQLIVQQCTEDWYTGAYDCANEKKPGFANQFIKYRLVSTPDKFILPDGQLDSTYTSISGDGHTAAFCNATPGINPGGPCTIQSAIYNKENNTLTYTNLNTFSIENDFYGAFPLLSYNGSSAWVIAHDSGVARYLFNSNIHPEHFLDALTSSFIYDIQMITGLDGSFWVDDSITSTTPLKSKFNTITNKLERITNAPNYIYGVTADGTLIGSDANFNLVCANSSDGVNYTSRPMTNFIIPTTYIDFIKGSGQGNSVRVIQTHNQFYGYMDFTANFVNGNPDVFKGVYFKITANSSHCSIATNNTLTFDPTQVTFYTSYMVYDDYMEVNGKITAAANSAVGF